MLRGLIKVIIIKLLIVLGSGNIAAIKYSFHWQKPYNPGH